MTLLTQIVIAGAYLLVAWRGFPALYALEFGRGSDADLKRLPTRGQTYGEFAILKGPARFNTVLLIALLPGFVLGKVVEAEVGRLQKKLARMSSHARA